MYILVNVYTDAHTVSLLKIVKAQRVSIGQDSGYFCPSRITSRAPEKETGNFFRERNRAAAEFQRLPMKGRPWRACNPTSIIAAPAHVAFPSFRRVISLQVTVWPPGENGRTKDVIRGQRQRKRVDRNQLARTLARNANRVRGVGVYPRVLSSARRNRFYLREYAPYKLTPVRLQQPARLCK